MKLSEVNLDAKDIHPNIKNIASDSKLFPHPVEVDITTGKGMWEFLDNKVWANSYGDAMNMFYFIRMDAFYGKTNSNNNEED